MVTRSVVGVLVLWAGTAAAEPYGCLGRDGRLRLLATSPPVCSPAEAPLTWDTAARATVRRRIEVARPTPPRVGTAALLAAFLLPRTAGR